jgi:hypothetical protein
MPFMIKGSLVSDRPGQVIPRQRISEDLDPAHDRGLRVLLGRLWEAAAEDRVAGVVGQAAPAKEREIRCRQVARAPAGYPGVQRHHDAFEACRLGAMHEAGCDITVGRRVQLEKPWGIAQFGGNLFYRVGRHRRCDHRHAGARGGARRRQVAMTVLCAQGYHSDGRHHGRRRQRHPEQLDRQIALLGADEHPWHQAPALEGGDIDPLCVFVSCAAGDIGPHSRGHRGPRLALQLREGHR